MELLHGYRTLTQTAFAWPVYVQWSMAAPAAAQVTLEANSPVRPLNSPVALEIWIKRPEKLIAGARTEYAAGFTATIS